MVKAEERRILHRVQGGAEKLWVGRSSTGKEKCDNQRDEESRREYWEARCTTKRTVTKAEAYSERYVRLTLKKENRNHWLDREIKPVRLMMKMKIC